VFDGAKQTLNTLSAATNNAPCNIAPTSCDQLVQHSVAPPVPRQTARGDAPMTAPWFALMVARSSLQTALLAAWLLEQVTTSVLAQERGAGAGARMATVPGASLQ
jgi:hypothetical protein